MVTMDVFSFQGKMHMLEPGIEVGTSWLVVRSSDHQATRLVIVAECILKEILFGKPEAIHTHTHTHIPLPKKREAPCIFGVRVNTKLH